MSLSVYTSQDDESVIVQDESGRTWDLTAEDARDLARELTLSAGRVRARADAEDNECEGHESLAGEHMGETVFCDGTCKTGASR
jgi:hypothetical protein